MYINHFHVVSDDRPGTLRYSLMSDAERLKVDTEQYRLIQARVDLGEAGFIEQADGTWLPGDNS